MKSITSVLAVAAIAGSAFGVDFFGTALDTGYQGNSGALTNTHALSDSIRGLETLWTGGGFSHANAGFGSIIGVSSNNPGGFSQNVYRVDNALSGVPSLVTIDAITSGPVADLTVGNGKIYGVRTTGPGSNLFVHEFDSNFDLQNSYDTGITAIDVGAGGIAYDASSDSFYLTDPDSDNLWNWSIGGGSATLVGTNSFDFDNNDLAIDPNTGTLYGAIENVSDGSWEFGYFSKTSGQFTSLVVVDNSSGSVGLAIPSPATLALVGLGGLVAGRRRR